MIPIGLDLGTKTIVLAKRSEDGKPTFKKEINGFFDFPNFDKFTKNMLVSQGIPHIELNDKLYGLGSKAEKFAYAVNSTLKRPMAEGVISKEKEAITIMGAIVKAIIGKLEEDAVLYYCIPADALNKDTNVKFHDKVANMILSSYEGKKIEHYSINEARALGIEYCQRTGQQIVIAISWGAGMVNVCYLMFGMPIFEFSLVGSGDWIDTQTAMNFGFDPSNPNKTSEETPTSICHRKEKIDLTKPVGEADRVDQAIMLNYQILIENVVTGIIEGFKNNADKAKIDAPIPIAMGGGTSSPNGFGDYFKNIISKADLPFDLADITVNDRPLYSVAEGCLIAAEAHLS